MYDHWACFLQPHLRFLGDIMTKTPYWLFAVLILLLAGLQYRVWKGEGSVEHLAQLNQQIIDQQNENERLLERNHVLEAEVSELKKGLETVEERARQELGMIKENETFYMLVQ